MTALDTLKQYTTVVVDTGDVAQIAQFQPQDATTNPSLILKAVQNPSYQPFLQEVVMHHGHLPTNQLLELLVVRFGIEILKVIKGRVSTEVDARFSFDIEKTIASARRIIKIYEENSVDKSRVLIKIAATWEGICAAEILEKEGIHTNLTLLFSFCQAVACAQAGVKLISPFVGRIYDWYKARACDKWIEADHANSQDPGVKFVTTIYNYYKKLHIQTEIMGASFRNTGQVLALTGCDLLTISPDLLSQLQTSAEVVEKKLSAQYAQAMNIQAVKFDEFSFRWALNEDAMATEKLAEGIRIFAQDAIKLESCLRRF